MSNADRGREQIEAAIMNFPNRIPDNIDLSQFMDDEIIHRVKDASQYKDSVLKMLSGEIDKGDSLPFTGLHGNFEFRPAEMTVWSGYKGHGKSSLISQVLENAISTHGQKVFIISPEFPPHRVIYKLMIQFLENRHPSRDEFDSFFDVMSKYLWIYDQQRSIKPDTIAPLCRFAVEKLGVKHILIDSLMKCGISPDDLSKQKHFIDGLQNVAHTSNCHIHLVAHGRKDKNDNSMPGLHDIKGTSEIADMVENVIFVWRNKLKEQKPNDYEKQKEPDAIIKIDAQRNADGWIGEVNLNYNKATMKFTDWSDGI